MSKYNALWESIRERGQPRLTLSFDAVEELAGMPLDHSFLKYKKELIPFGYTVGKISMKEQTVTFSKICEDKNTSR